MKAKKMSDLERAIAMLPKKQRKPKSKQELEEWKKIAEAAMHTYLPAPKWIFWL